MFRRHPPRTSQSGTRCPRPRNPDPEVVTVQDMLKDFKAFILRGNVLDLAIAVVIGAAFGAVVTALVNDLITPIIAIPGKSDFSSLHFTIRNSRFLYGHFINAVISFLSIA